MVDRLTRSTERLSEFPLSGRMVPEFDLPDIREVIEGPYRIVYRVLTEQVDVLAVIHGAHRMPPVDSL